MSNALERVSQEAIQLPRHQRLALARFLIELDGPSCEDDVDRVWEAEIGERVRAVEEGWTEGIPYDQVLARIDKTLAR